MIILRRLVAIVLVLAVPAAITAILYTLSIVLLRATNRVIDPQVLHYSIVIEYAVFFFLAALEAKNRW